MPTLFWAFFLPPAFGFILDLFFGDPPRLPHPVRLFGAASIYLEKALRPRLRCPAGEAAGGLLLTALIAGGAYGVTFTLVKLSFNIGFPWGLLVSTAFIYSALAVKDMLRHIKQVEQALTRHNLRAARGKAALLVSRDTSGLNETEISRAALESLFENQADGVTAPLFFAALGGPPLAIFYKAVNTLDSMIGYKTPRYRYFGRAAASLDDLLNYLPARLSALFLLLAGFTFKGPRQRTLATLRIFHRDRGKHGSPNSGRPEAAGAAVLNVQLGGPDHREGRIVTQPLINWGGRLPETADLKEGRKLFLQASLLALFFCLGLSWLRLLLLFQFFPEVFR